MTKKRKKKSILHSRFYQIYFLLILLCLIAIGVGLGVERGVLTEYEATRPAHAAEPVAHAFESRNFGALFSYDTAAQTYAPGETARYADFLNTYTAGKTVSCREAYSADANEKKYSVYADDEKIAVFTLRQTGEVTEHGYPIWTTGSVETLVLPIQRYTVTAPSDSVVTANGRALTDADALETGIKTACAGMLPEGVPEITKTCYFVDACFTEPVFSVVDRFGSTQTLTRDSEFAYSSEVPANTSLKEICEQNVLAVAHKLANFTSEDLSQNKMLSYTVKNSPAYKIVREFDNQWCPSHRSVEFRDESTSEYFDYGDSCFSCRVKFQYVIHYSNSPDNIYDTAYTLYFYKQGGGFKLYNFTMV